MILLNGLKDWVIKTNIDVTNYKKIIDNLTRVSESDKSGLSTKGQASKQFDLGNDDSLALIVNDVKKSIISSLKTHDLNLLSAWTVYGQKYGFHTVHKHNDENINHLGSVLFLEVPSVIELDLPGDLFFILRDKDNNLLYESFSPKIGDFFIFPIHVLHGTYPQSEGLRQTLNLDFEIL